MCLSYIFICICEYTNVVCALFVYTTYLEIDYSQLIHFEYLVF